MLFTGMATDGGKWPDALYESCIGKIAEGDKDALGALYEGVRDAVFGFALSIVRNAQEAEDVLQDTFVSVYASAGSYRRMGKPMAWILTIAKNLALMKLRERRKTADVSEDEWGIFAADSAASVTSDDKLVLLAAMKRISPEESQVVMLHAVAGFKHREIAELLELPLSTVLSKYNRAIKKLKSALTKDAREEDAHAE